MVILSLRALYSGNWIGFNVANGGSFVLSHIGPRRPIAGTPLASNRYTFSTITSGGVLALGARFGHEEPADLEAQKKTYALVQEFFRRFQSQHGSCLCRELLQGIDLKTEEGQKQFKDRDMRNKVCVPCVRTAVEILEDLI